jgi:hypothetical protein
VWGIVGANLRKKWMCAIARGWQSVGLGKGDVISAVGWLVTGLLEGDRAVAQWRGHACIAINPNFDVGFGVLVRRFMDKQASDGLARIIQDG